MVTVNQLVYTMIYTMKYLKPTGLYYEIFKFLSKKARGILSQQYAAISYVLSIVAFYGFVLQNIFVLSMEMSNSSTV